VKENLLYVELKTGYNDNGPVWIGKGRYSKSGSTIYFNGRALKSCGGQGVGANYFDMETGEEYWVSGIKKNQQDRHWAGSGAVMIDKSVVDEYIKMIGCSKLNPKQYKIVELDHSDIRKRIYDQENKKL